MLKKKKIICYGMGNNKTNSFRHKVKSYAGHHQPLLSVVKHRQLTQFGPQSKRLTTENQTVVMELTCSSHAGHSEWETECTAGSPAALRHPPGQAQQLASQRSPCTCLSSATCRLDEVTAELQCSFYQL